MLSLKSSIDTKLIFDEENYYLEVNNVLNKFQTSLESFYYFDNSKKVHFFVLYLDVTNIIGYSIINEDSEKTDLNGEKMDGIKYWMSHFEISKNHRIMGYGRKFLGFIKKSISGDIYLLSLNSSTLFYLKNGAYCLNDVEFCLEEKCHMVLPKTVLPDFTNTYFKYMKNVIKVTKEVTHYLSCPDADSD